MRRRILLVLIIVAIAVASPFVYLAVDYYSHQNDWVQEFRDNPAALQGLQQLGQLPPSGATVFSLWDYGQPIHDIAGRTPTASSPSRDTFSSTGASHDRVKSIEYELFGTFDSSEKIHDIARALLLPENQSLPLMQKYSAGYAIVFHSGDLAPGVSDYAFNDLIKFSAIAPIAGYNSNDYLTEVYNSTANRVMISLTAKTSTSTWLRLLLDDKYPPQHFTKVYANSMVKIYRINYPATPTSSLETSVGSSFIKSLSLIGNVKPSPVFHKPRVIPFINSGPR